MTIEEKYLGLRQKSVNPKNNRYLFTYLENWPCKISPASRCLKGEVSKVSILLPIRSTL